MESNKEEKDPTEGMSAGQIREKLMEYELQMSCVKKYQMCERFNGYLYKYFLKY